MEFYATSHIECTAMKIKNNTIQNEMKIQITTTTTSTSRHLTSFFVFYLILLFMIVFSVISQSIALKISSLCFSHLIFHRKQKMKEEDN